MNIVHEKPRFFFILKLFFPEADWDAGVIVTYGKNIYCKYVLTHPLVMHEQTHVRQQEGKIIWWWFIKYSLYPKFRLSVEIPAHRAEYRAIAGFDGNKKGWLELIAGRLSGPLYNNMVTLDEAKKLILSNEEKEI